MKIAMIGQKGAPATFGGVERHVEELSAALAGRGHHVVVFVRPSYTRACGAWRGFDLCPLPSIPTKHLDAITHAALCTLAALAEPFDILHYHAVGPALLSFLPRCLGRRVVATAHAADWQRAKWGSLARKALRAGAWMAVHAPHETIAVSRALAQAMAWPGRRVTVIPNGVPAAVRRPFSRLARFGLTPGRFVLWMGRFTPEKRCEDLIAAWRSAHVDAMLLLAAEPGENPEYEGRLRRLAEGDARIAFAGGIYGEEKDEALSHAAAFVLASELEGLPVAMLEAMRAGLCVVAGDIPAVREAAVPDRTALLYPVGDPAALRQRIEWVLEHPTESRAMGEAGRTSLGREYDWDRVAEKTEGVYRRALGGRGRGVI